MKTAILYFSSCFKIENADCHMFNLNTFIGEEQLHITDTKEIIDLITSTKGKIRTSQPSTESLVLKYKELLLKYDNVLVITPSSKLSGAYQNCLLAAQELSNIYVIDSKSLTFSEYNMVTTAVELLQNNNSVEDVVESISSINDNLITYIVPNTFDYLNYSGRISTPKNLLAKLLNLKVIIKYVPVDSNATTTDLAQIHFKSRGDTSVFSEIENILSKYKSKKVFFGSIFTSEDKKSFFEKLITKYNLEIIDLGTAPAIISSQIGPNAFAFGIFE